MTNLTFPTFSGGYWGIKMMIECPLCGNQMRKDGDYYRCSANQLHACLIDKEWARYISREKDMRWLRWRMKVRLGKMVRGR